MRQGDLDLEYERLLATHDSDAQHLKIMVEHWARARDAWESCGWFGWRHCQPRPGECSVYLVSESNMIDLATLWSEGEWIDMMDGSAFEYDLLNHYTMVFWHRDDQVREAARRRSELEWVSELVAPDIALVHEEVYAHFRGHPEDVERLPWRRLEELVAAAFAGQGIRVALGQGRCDGGIDLRLLDHPVFGDVMTAVQIKSGRTPVRLHFVQALASAATVDGAERALFVTSSRYLPGAVKWAEAWSASHRTLLSLATAADVADWCAAAHARTWYPNRALRDPQPTGHGDVLGAILCARNGWRLVTYRYGFVVRQTSSAVLLRLLPTRIVGGDVQRGLEVPTIPEPSPSDSHLAAQRNGDAEWIGVDGNIYARWNGQPMHFDRMD